MLESVVESVMPLPKEVPEISKAKYRRTHAKRLGVRVKLSGSKRALGKPPTPVVHSEATKSRSFWSRFSFILLTAILTQRTV